MSEKIRLTEFAELTGLAPSSILLMIERGELTLVDLDSPPVKIDLAQLDLQVLLKPQTSESNSSDLMLSEHETEVLASELTQALESMIKEAYALALKWRME